MQANHTENRLIPSQIGTDQAYKSYLLGMRHGLTRYNNKSKDYKDSVIHNTKFKQLNRTLLKLKQA